MSKLVYLMNVSLDGYVETPDHSLDWTNVDEETLRWFNEETQAMDAFLYGSRLYKLMDAYWPTAESDPNATAATLEYARIWNAKPKIVFSSSLAEVGPNDRLVRTDDVAAELARLRTEFNGVLSVGGPTLASQFIARDLVDEYRLVIHPVILGAGTPFFPRLAAPLGLRLRETHAFHSGTFYIGYERA